MEKEAKYFIFILLAICLYISSAFFQEEYPIISLSLIGISVFMGIFCLIMALNISSEVRVVSPPSPVRERVVVHKHRHEHHNYDFNECTEAKEVSHTLPDGRTVSFRHVRKWK